ncbi:low temperature requirement protein A, partial [Ramlibacter sp.]|uniref:low temperature requirement protein A n=1 Tax=Ramlibacter sp. TaxID=1917967 RepID=UPI002FC9600D
MSTRTGARPGWPEPPWSYIVFYGGIVFDIVALVLLNRRLHLVPAHTPHLVERIGLLTIIMLGESVISISA